MTDPAAVNQATLGRFIKAWLGRDVATVLDCLTDDIEYCTSTGPDPGRTFRGKDAVGPQFEEQILAGDDGSELVLDDPVVTESWGLGGWRITLPGGGRLRGVDVYRFRDGRICAKDVFRKCP